MSNQQYAAPIGPYSMNDADLARLREKLADAERVAARATDYTTRTRAEGDVRIIKRELNGAELQRKVEAAQQRLNTPAPDAHAVLRELAVEQGQCMAPVPYFARDEQKTQERVPPQQTPAQELADLKAKAAALKATADDPQVGFQARMKASLEWSKVTGRIQELEAATGPTGTAGMTFDAVAQIVEQARKDGVVASYNIVRPK